MEHKVNIAPSSTSGHFVEGKSVQVIDIDKTNETFVVLGESVLTTENHTELDMKSDCLVTCQMVYDPLKKIFEKSQD